MAQYTIQVVNNSGFSKDYVVFSEPPQVTKSGTDVEVYSNAWVTFSGVRSGSFDKLTYDDSVDAYWGTSPQRLSPSVVVQQGGIASVNTETCDGVVFTGKTPPGFGSVTSGVANTGAFQITANPDFTADFNYVFGMAKSTGPNTAAPVATFLAEPNDTFEVIPVVQFYVADGAYTAGAIIDVKSTSTNAAKIDFTGKRQTTAVVTQNDDGSFGVAYS